MEKHFAGKALSVIKNNSHDLFTKKSIKCSKLVKNCIIRALDINKLVFDNHFPRFWLQFNSPEYIYSYQWLKLGILNITKLELYVYYFCLHIFQVYLPHTLFNCSKLTSWTIMHSCKCGKRHVFRLVSNVKVMWYWPLWTVALYLRYKCMYLTYEDVYYFILHYNTSIHTLANKYKRSLSNGN